MNCFALILFSAFTVSGALAQRTDFSNESAFKFPSSKIMNEFSSPEGTNLPAKNENVSDEVLKSFKTEYQNAEKVTWLQVNKNYLAKFSNGNIAMETLLNKHGKIIYSIAYGVEKDLPKNVKTLVYAAYPEHIITNVAKVTRKNRQIWVITSAGQYDDVRFRVEGGQIEEVETIQK